MTRFLLIAALLPAALALADEPQAKPAEIPVVQTMDDLRQANVVARLSHWDARLGIADAGDETGPMKLLVLHLKFAGKAGDDRELPELRGGQVASEELGPMRYHVRQSRAKISHQLLESARRLQEIRKGEDREVERVYVSLLPACQQGDLTVEVFDPIRGEKVLAACEFKVAEEVVWPWIRLLGSPGGGPREEAAPEPRLNQRLEPYTPRIEQGSPAWVRREDMEAPPQKAAPLPGLLSPAQWPDGLPRPRGAAEGAGKVYPLKAGVQDGSLVIQCPAEILLADAENWLVRWWVNGRAIGVRMDDREVLEKVLQERLRQRAVATAHLRLPWDLPDHLGMLSEGDEVAFQVMYCPAGTREVEPFGLMQERLKEAATTICGPRQPLLSPKVTLNITRPMLAARARKAAGG